MLILTFLLLQLLPTGKLSNMLLQMYHKGYNLKCKHVLNAFEENVSKAHVISIFFFLMASS